MDLAKIGAYIAAKRKSLGLTQRQVAETLGMSDKSVSKWERGICLPDVSVYLELCSILGITLNEFFAGEDIPEQDLGVRSEENLLQVTASEKRKRKRMKRIIAALLVVILLLTGVGSCVLYKSSIADRNSIIPLTEDSTERKTAQLLADVDGAYLYRYEAEAGYKSLDLELVTYQNGQKIGKLRKLISMKLDGNKGCTGILAIVPDFQHYQTRVICANEEEKYQTEFSILDDVDDREYYGRSATEITESVSLQDGNFHGLLALFYAKDELQAIQIESLEADGSGDVNDYVYYLSVRLCK